MLRVTIKILRKIERKEMEKIERKEMEKSLPRPIHLRFSKEKGKDKKQQAHGNIFFHFCVLRLFL